MKKKKVLLISLDALACTEFEYLRNLPNFSKIIKQGAYCPKLYSIYPSITFPCHASIATGCMPASHGIVNNYILSPTDKVPRWNAFAANLKCKAIWDYAKENGKKVLNMSWPVSSGADIEYSMPEMSPPGHKVWNADTFYKQLKQFEEYGTLSFATEILLSDERLPKSWTMGVQPDLDECMMKAFLNAINSYDFDIGLFHIYGMDDAKHNYGTIGNEVETYLRMYDNFVGNLLEYIEQHKDGENITLMVTGDHSQKDVEFAIYGNMILEDHGFLEYENEALVSYRAYMDSGDGMAYIYMNAENKEELLVELKEIFEGYTGIEEVMLKDKFEKLGCDPKADLVLEAKDGYYFESGYEIKALKEESRIISSPYKAVHGYLPWKKDYQTMFFSFGQDVKAMEIESMGIIDILPTICQWMDIELDKIDGISQDIWKDLNKGV